MEAHGLINERVTDYYEIFNCATTMIKILSELFGITLCSQVLDSAIGMHGGGRFQAQCGLVEGSLMFIGILGRGRGLADEMIVASCYNFANQFQLHFGSLVCKDLRPQGFKPENPPHLCVELEKKAVAFTAAYIQGIADHAGSIEVNACDRQKDK
jgi:C_GCAxxG_C_C family probable redox protein